MKFVGTETKKSMHSLCPTDKVNKLISGDRGKLYLEEKKTHFCFEMRALHNSAQQWMSIVDTMDFDVFSSSW